VIELRKIGKQFPGVRALHDVSLTIEAGEVLGLCGENGAGKSTLIKILGGVYAAGGFTGEVVVAGKVQAFRGTRDARRAGIAVVHQELALVPDMTVAENLVLGREPARFGLVDAASTQAAARAVLASLGDAAAEIPLDARAGELGVGVQQLLEIARALADRARVVVLDEPTAALTDRETQRLFELVRARRGDGTAFVYISHRLDEIRELCDRVAVLRDGALVGVVPPGDLDHVVRLMTGAEGALGIGLQALGSDPDSGQSPKPEAQSPILDVRDLSIAHPTLPGRRVVDGLSFAVHPGEVVALAGAMGAGRTATLSALFGVARAAVTGEIRVAGRTVAIRSPRDAIAAGMALVPEDRKAHGVVLGASVAANLALPALPALSRFGLVDAARAEQLAHTRVRDLSIKAPGLGAEVATLSGGNQQKVVIGKWLELAPKILLLDEPTRGVDVGAKAELYALIEQLLERGHAVVLASSDLPEVVRLADRVLVLREGKLAGELAGDQITQLAIMQLAVGTLAAAMAQQGAPHAARA
jgi:ABC-type sugar transport system ATPase subunit